MTLFLNNSNGTFADDISYLGGDGPTSVVLSDINLDSKPDAVVAVFKQDLVAVLRNILVP